MRNYRPASPFDIYRSSFSNTDFSILRCPKTLAIGYEPFTSGTSTWQSGMVDSMVLSIARPATGKLNVQCILRSFGDRWTEVTVGRSFEATEAAGEVEVPLAIPCNPDLAGVPRSVEPWLTWEGDRPLELWKVPILVC